MGAGQAMYAYKHNYSGVFFSQCRMLGFFSAVGFSIIRYSCEKWRKNSLAQFANSSLYSIIPLSCILWGKPRFGLSIMLLIIDGPDFLVMILSPIHDDFINP